MQYVRKYPGASTLSNETVPILSLSPAFSKIAYMSCYQIIVQYNTPNYCYCHLVKFHKIEMVANFHEQVQL